VDSAIYGEIPDAHHQVAAYSVLLGLYTFGPEGVVIGILRLFFLRVLMTGPVLACLPVMGYHVFCDLTADSE
jgi:hypothetical protein